MFKPGRSKLFYTIGSSCMIAMSIAFQLVLMCEAAGFRIERGWQFNQVTFQLLMMGKAMVGALLG